MIQAVARQASHCDKMRKAKVRTLVKSKRTAYVLLVTAVALAVFALGMLVGANQWGPYRAIADGIKTGGKLLTGLRDRRPSDFAGFSEVPLQSASANRIRPMAGAARHGSLLWYGGRHQFLDLCHPHSCLAVVFTGAGDVAQAYPFRPAKLENAARESTAEFRHELPPLYSRYPYMRYMRPIGIARYPNGDLLATFQTYKDLVFPYSGGLARIDSEGRPVWFRRDLSHHWPQLLPDGTALVPGHKVASEDFSYEDANGASFTLDCKTDRPVFDTVNFIDGQGRLLERIDLMRALRSSRFARVLQYSTDACDPLHLNYVTRLEPDAGGAWGMSPGDLVVSLRSLSAFAIIDGSSHRLKRVVRGSFFQQHAVTHLSGSTFLMFDNNGGDGVHGPSRLLSVDLSTGRETTLFPNARTPEALRSLYSRWRGNIDVSPDRLRAIVVFSLMGIAVEIRLADGAVLNVFRSLHDVANLEQYGAQRRTRAATFYMNGLDYIR